MASVDESGVGDLESAPGRLWVIVLAVVLLVAYFLAVIPSLTHASFREAGEVVSCKELSAEEIPGWFEPYIRLLGSTSPVILNVVHNGPRESYAILTDSPVEQGKLVIFTHPVATQNIDWRVFDFLGFEFDRLRVGEVGIAKDGFFSRVEVFSFYSDSKDSLLVAVMMFISTAAVLVGPVLVFIYIPYLLFRSFSLWQIVGAIWLYLYDPFLMGLAAAGEIAIWALVFVIVGFITLHLWRLERSQGRTRAMASTR